MSANRTNGGGPAVNITTTTAPRTNTTSHAPATMAPVPHHHSVTRTIALAPVYETLPPVELLALGALGLAAKAATGVTAVAYAACAITAASLVEGGNKAATASRLIGFSQCQAAPGPRNVLVPGWWQLVPTSTPSDTASLDVLAGMVLNSALLVILGAAVVIVCAIRQPATEADLTTTAATAGAFHSVVLGYLAPSGVAASATLLAAVEIEGGVVGIFVNVVVMLATAWACTLRVIDPDDEGRVHSAQRQAIMSVRDRAGEVMGLFVDGSRDVKQIHIRMHAFVDLTVAAAIALLYGLLPVSSTFCAIGGGLSVLLLGARLAYTTVLRPHKLPYYQYASIAMAALQVLLALASTAAAATGPSGPAAKAAAAILILNDLGCVGSAALVVFVVMTTVNEAKTVKKTNPRKPNPDSPRDNEVPLLAVPPLLDSATVVMEDDGRDPSEIRNPLLLKAASTGVWQVIPSKRPW